MITQFQIMDLAGDAIADGEIDGSIYRVFSDKHPSECEEFESLSEMLEACGGIAIQPMLFDTPPRTRQLNLLGGSENEI